MSTAGNESIVIPPTLVSLKNNDEITVRLRSHNNAGARVRGGHSVSNVSLFVCN